jgi:hypothetical protein
MCALPSRLNLCLPQRKAENMTNLDQGILSMIVALVSDKLDGFKLLEAALRKSDDTLKRFSPHGNARPVRGRVSSKIFSPAFLRFSSFWPSLYSRGHFGSRWPD